MIEDDDSVGPFSFRFQFIIAILIELLQKISRISHRFSMMISITLLEKREKIKEENIFLVILARLISQYMSLAKFMKIVMKRLLKKNELLQFLHLLVKFCRTAFWFPKNRCNYSETFETMAQINSGMLY